MGIDRHINNCSYCVTHLFVISKCWWNSQLWRLNRFTSSSRVKIITRMTSQKNLSHGVQELTEPPNTYVTIYFHNVRTPIVGSWVLTHKYRIGVFFLIFSFKALTCQLMHVFVTFLVKWKQLVLLGFICILGVYTVLQIMRWQYDLHIEPC